MAEIKRYLIRLGDKTTHGGEIITAWGRDCPETKADQDGIPYACIGDKGTCPRCRGTYEIIPGDNVKHRPTVGGRAIASTADFLTCGCQPLASQNTRSYTDDGWVDPIRAAGMARQEATAQAARGIQTASATPGISAEEARLLKEQNTTEQKVFDEQIQFTDKQGNTLKKVAYKLYSGGALLKEGITDDNGMTQRVTTDKETQITKAALTFADLKLDVPLEGIVTNSSEIGSSNVIQSVQLDTIEVLISDTRLISAGSQFGHTAIEIDGQVFGRAPKSWDVDTRDHYLQRQNYRDTWGYKLLVTPLEKSKIQAFINKKISQNKGYDFLINSCSSNTAEALGAAGLIAHDPRYVSFTVSPLDVATGLKHSKRLTNIVTYPKK